MLNFLFVADVPQKKCTNFLVKSKLPYLWNHGINFCDILTLMAIAGSQRPGKYKNGGQINGALGGGNLPSQR